MVKPTLCLSMIVWSLIAFAGVFYAPERNALWLMDYPPEAPCELSRLAETDRAFGWGRVTYDNATNTCVVNSDLIIGVNDGSETTLKIGSAERPNETLIMKGNLYIHPSFIRGENKGKYWQAPQKTNALILGEKDNKAIKATLKFACSPTEKHTLSCGNLPWADRNAQWGGGLYVHNSQIMPLNPAPGSEIGDGVEGFYLMGSTVLDSAAISGVKGMLYRMGPGVNRNYLVRNTIFERVETPLACGPQKMSGCAFINCGTAVLDRGGLDAELTDCVFKGNARNWSLTYSDNGLVCVDCDWDTPRKEDLYRVYVDAKGKTRRPKFTNRRHVAVEVVDAADKPVKDAVVSFRAEQDGCDLLQNRTFKTDADGKTPGKGQENALSLTEYIKTATDAPDRPETKTFTYSITAEMGKKRATVSRVCPDVSWKLIKLKLE